MMIDQPGLVTWKLFEPELICSEVHWHQTASLLACQKKGRAGCIANASLPKCAQQDGVFRNFIAQSEDERKKGWTPPKRLIPFRCDNSRARAYQSEANSSETHGIAWDSRLLGMTPSFSVLVYGEDSQVPVHGDTIPCSNRATKLMQSVDAGNTVFPGNDRAVYEHATSAFDDGSA